MVLPQLQIQLQLQIIIADREHQVILHTLMYAKITFGSDGSSHSSVILKEHTAVVCTAGVFLSTVSWCVCMYTMYIILSSPVA